MPSVLVIGTAQKAAGDKVRIPMDFGNEPLLLDGFTITSFSVTAAGLTVADAQLDYPYQLSCVVSGGSAGMNYDVIYIVTFNDPDTSVRARTGTLKVL